MFFDEDMNSAWLSRPGTWEFAPSNRLGAINSCEATPIWGFAQALIGPPASVIGLQGLVCVSWCGKQSYQNRYSAWKLVWSIFSVCHVGGCKYREKVVRCACFVSCGAMVEAMTITKIM